MKTNTLVLQMI